MFIHPYFSYVQRKLMYNNGLSLNSHTFNRVVNCFLCLISGTLPFELQYKKKQMFHFYSCNLCFSFNL